LQCVAMCCSVLQCVAVCCSVLQCVAVCCSVLQCVAVCSGVLQCVAVYCMCCSVLQCVAVYCSMFYYMCDSLRSNVSRIPYLHMRDTAYSISFEKPNILVFFSLNLTLVEK